MKILEKNSVYDIEANPIDISEFIKFEIRDFLNSRILLIYIEILPQDIKFVFTINKKNQLLAYERKLEGDHPIDKNKIDAKEHIIAYLYKSEKENENYNYKILLTPDNKKFRINN